MLSIAAAANMIESGCAFTTAPGGRMRALNLNSPRSPLSPEVSVWPKIVLCGRQPRGELGFAEGRREGPDKEVHVGSRRVGARLDVVNPNPLCILKSALKIDGGVTNIGMLVLYTIAGNELGKAPYHIFRLKFAGRGVSVVQQQPVFEAWIGEREANPSLLRRECGFSQPGMRMPGSFRVA